MMLIDSCGVCDRSDAEKLLGDKPKSPKSGKSPLSIPCLIKQPLQPEQKGIIRKDLGDSFVVYIPSEDSTVTVPKLLVYPDFSGGVGQIPPTKQVTPPSKTRRKKGEGTGYIYRRTITRRGKQYRESYYRYRDESGKLRSKYIPQRLLDRVEEAEQGKLPVVDVLKLLGGDEINRGEHSSTLGDKNVQKSESNLISRGEQSIPPSTKRRKQGYGGGYIECKPIKRGGKEYKQYWYHYEFWREGDRSCKKSRYIPKRLVQKVERMNDEKVAVREILEVLGVKG